MIVFNWVAWAVVKVAGWIIPGTKGVTIWPCIFIWPKEDLFNGRLLRHEIKHLEQWRRYWVIGYWFVYRWHHYTKGYESNPLEIEARNAARQNSIN